jgi:hypothetical protein
LQAFRLGDRVVPAADILHGPSNISLAVPPFFKDIFHVVFDAGVIKLDA